MSETNSPAEIASTALKAWNSEQYSMSNGRYNAWRQGRCVPAECTIKHYQEGTEALAAALRAIENGVSLEQQLKGDKEL